MSTTQQKALSNHRRRMKRKGFVRLEVKVRKEDVPLIRDMVGALADPDRSDEARALLRSRFAADGGAARKTLLAAAPLEGIDLERTRDVDRDVDL